MSPAATALDAPSHLRVRLFTKTKGSAPIPVASAVSNAKRKTWNGAVACTRLTLVAPAHSCSPTGRPVRACAVTACGADQIGVEFELVGDQAREEESVPYYLPSRSCQLGTFLGITEQEEELFGALLDGADKEAAGAAWHLHGDAAGLTRDHRGALPQRLGDDEPEALADGLLDAH